MMSSTPRHRGFTLAELLVVLAIALVSMSVAFPGLAAHVQRSRTTPALMELSVFRIKMDKSYQRDARYGTNGRCAVVAEPLDHFSMQCTLNNDGKGFTVDAIGKGAMAGYHYRTDEVGRQQTLAHPHATAAQLPCWSPEGRACGA